jgi:hypothetical protein
MSSLADSVDIGTEEREPECEKRLFVRRRLKWRRKKAYAMDGRDSRNSDHHCSVSYNAAISALDTFKHTRETAFSSSVNIQLLCRNNLCGFPEQSR